MSRGVILGAVEDPVEGGVRCVRTIGTVGRCGELATMKEFVVSRNPEKQTIYATDGSDRARLDVINDGRRGETVRLGGIEYGRGVCVGVIPPELGDPGLVAGFDEGYCET